MNVDFPTPGGPEKPILIDLPGFLIAWGYWLAIVFSITAISTAFVGYLGVIIPQIGSSSLIQALLFRKLLI